MGKHTIEIDPENQIVYMETVKGKRIEMDDLNDKISVDDGAGNNIVIDTAGGTITWTDVNGNIITSKSSGVDITASTVNILSGTINLGNSAGEKVVLGSSFKPIFEGHTHGYAWTDAGGSGKTDPPGSSVPLSGVTKTE